MVFESAPVSQDCGDNVVFEDRRSRFQRENVERNEYVRRARLDKRRNTTAVIIKLNRRTGMQNRRVIALDEAEGQRRRQLRSFEWKAGLKGLCTFLVLNVPPD